MRIRTYLFCTAAWSLIAGLNLAQGAWVVGFIDLAVAIAYGLGVWGVALDADKAEKEKNASR